MTGLPRIIKPKAAAAFWARAEKLPLKLRLLLAAGAYAALAASGFARLDFCSTTIVLKAVAGQEVLRGQFVFTNSGKAAVTILEVKAACGCTSGVPEKKVYAPGETGTIAATFAIGERVGHQVKTLILRTDEGTEGLYQLKLEADIPPYITVEPRLLLWPRGSVLEAKTVTIGYPAGKFLKLTSFGDASGHFRARLAGPGGQPPSSVFISPVATDTPLLATMMFTFTREDGYQIQRSVFLRILGEGP
jgi:hypothetical protein